jgi:hypothetical protein
MPDTPVEAAPVAPVAQPLVDDNPVPNPTPRANVPAKNAGEAFDAIAAEAKEEIAEREKEDSAIDEAAKKAAADATASDEEDDADDEEEDDKAEEEEEEDDKAEDADKPEVQEEAEKSVAEQILELMRNPETLEAALRQAGVETIQELPFVKDIVGRAQQSTADQTKNEIAKAEWEAKNIEGVMVEGRAAQKSIADAVEKLAKDLEEGLEDFDVPSTDLINEAFEKFGKGAMQAYHNAHFSQITNKVYQYPEYQSLSQEQRDTLSKMDGAAPADWVEAHLEVGRENLWKMAQEDVAAQAKQYVEDQTKILVEAHKAEVEKLQTKFDKKLERAIAKTAEETQAAALANFATKGSPPKTPKKDSTPNVDDEEVDYTSFESIAESVKKSLARGGSGV